jgi:hypothetical protein
MLEKKSLIIYNFIGFSAKALLSPGEECKQVLAEP